ncbi:MAG: response regulator [Oscillatoriales cyanobacterium RM2_1_1]|nr:response regulator [Oscillatoriales cyanobacterium RM2_1_1]
MHQTNPEILIVDDTPDNLRILTHLLVQQGYEVRAATSGQMALESIQLRQPSLILLDIYMANMDGYEVCCQIKASPETQDIPVIFLSALGDQSDKVKAFEVGGVDYITKPFQAQEVLARIATHLTLSQLTKTLEQQVQERTTELAQALQNLQQTQLQLVQQEKLSALGQLIAGIGYEINNPISSISGNLGFAQNYVEGLTDHLKLYQSEFPQPGERITQHAVKIELDYLTEDLPQIMQSMRGSADRIFRLSQSIQTFFRIDVNHPVLFDIHDGLESTLLILKHRLSASKHRPEIQIIKNYDLTIPQISCYPGQLTQVFMNLVTNAIDALEEAWKAPDANQRSLRIEIRTLSLDEQKIGIQMIDNGPGIPAKIRAKIFDYLFTTKIKGYGTGLGLAIAQQIIEEKHGGKLECHSFEGQGAEFVITLPIESAVAKSNLEW